MKKIALALILIIQCFNSKAQDEFKPILSFKIRITTENGITPIKFARIISYSTLESWMADSLGYFSSTMATTDSLRVAALGYYPTTIKVAQLSSNYINYFALKPYSILLPEITFAPILADSVPLNIYLPEDIKNNTASSTPMRLRYQNTEGIAAAFNPIYAIYNSFSKEVKSKNKVRQLMANEKKRVNFHYKLLNRDIIEDESGFKGDSLQKLILLCNTHIKLRPYYKEVHVRMQIRALMDSLRNQNPDSSVILSPQAP